MEFTYPVNSPYIQKALNMPPELWCNMSDDQLKAVVEYFKREKPDLRIGKIHFNFSNSIDYRYVFEGFNVIDLRPPVNAAWITRALHLFKSALRRKTEDYTRFSAIFGAEEKFAEHVRLHGWWPEWYVWRGPISLEQFLDEELMHYHTYIQSLPPALDTLINSIEFTLDETMPWIDKLKNNTGTDLGDDHIRDFLRPWIRMNNDILDFLGLREHLGKDYDWQTKNNILKTKFIAKQHDILRFNQGDVT